MAENSPEKRALEQATRATAEERCPPVEVWLEVCAGTAEPAHAERYLSHAARCADCSHALAEASAVMREDVSPEEEAMLARMATSTPRIQARLADRLYEVAVRVSAPVPVKARRGMRWPVWLTGGALACATAAVTMFLLWPTDNRLLVTAYNEHRPSQLRIPGSASTPLASTTRGPGENQDSSDLLKLQAKATEKLEKSPEDAKARQMMGRIALVKHDGAAARTQFEVVQTTDPQLKGLTLDLALAYFELAESENDKEKYAQAANYFSQYLQNGHAHDPVALFDRGLCWERQSIDHQAVADFEAALAHEKDTAWRKEIQEHLDRVRKRISSLDKPTEADPALYERQLALGSREWLGARSRSAAAEKSLAGLAELGKEHRDLWMSDMLQGPVTPQRQAADGLLAEALQDGSEGKTDQAVAASEQAMHSYRQARSQPGFLRAAAEHIYELQRAGQARRSLQEVAALRASGPLERYPWLQSDLLLQTAGAYAMLGDAERNRSYALESARRSADAGLPLLELRARAYVLDADYHLERFQTAWNEGVDDLQAAGSLQGSETARYSVLYTMMMAAKAVDLRWTHEGLAEATADASARLPNQLAHAYALEELALDQIELGQSDAATQTFRAAEDALHTLGVGNAARQYAADWEIDRALLQASRNDQPGAIAKLAAEEREVERPDAIFHRLRFYTTYAELLCEAHRTNQCVDNILTAVSDAERRLADTHNEADRQAWREQTSRTYEVLVLALADSGEKELALRAWEWFNLAPYRKAGGPGEKISRQDLGRLLPGLPETAASGALTLVYARVLGGYVAWSISETPRSAVHMEWVKTSAEAIVQQEAVFLRLCADPHSSLLDVQTMGSTLYTELVLPFEGQVKTASRLSLHLDRSLASLPVAALRNDGKYFGLVHAVTLLSDAWLQEASQEACAGVCALPTEQMPQRAQVVLLQGRARPQASLIPEEYDESRTLQTTLPHAVLVQADLRRDGNGLTVIGPPELAALLGQADILHYAGHGLGNDGAGARQSLEGGQMPMRKGLLRRCTLVVLAACRSLREREDNTEGASSFAGLFLEAGVRNVVGTQWDVDTDKTRRLMLGFYAELTAGHTFSEALRGAQASLQRDTQSAHPYFWSGFQLIRK